MSTLNRSRNLWKRMSGVTARPLGLSASASLALVVACSDHDPTAVTAPRVAPGATAAAAGARSAPLDVAPLAFPAEYDALNELTRAVALAFKDNGVRQRVKNDMRESRFTNEHKLELAGYLRGTSGGILLAKMAKETGRDRGSLLALIETVGPLEFYMPVREQREQWTGGADVLVASLLMEGDAPVAYTPTGERIALDPKSPPSTPVVAIVPRESDFTRPITDPKAKNVNDKGGSSIGTMLVPCEPDTCGGGGGGPVAYPPGLYLNHNRVVDNGEAWGMGDPEIEVLVIGPAFDPSQDGERLACSGQYGSGPKHFNQNGNFWTATEDYVEGELLNQAEIERYHSVYSQGYSIQVFESDKDPHCQADVDDRTAMQRGLQAARDAFAVGGLMVRIYAAYDWNVVIASALAIRAIIVDRYVWDDLMGNLVARERVNGADAPYYATHVLIRGVNSDGSAKTNGYAILKLVTP